MAPASSAAGESPSALPLTTNMTATSLTSGGNSCLDEQIERLKRCEYLREGEVKALCLRAREILVDESNVQRVDAPVTVRKIRSALLLLLLLFCFDSILECLLSFVLSLRVPGTGVTNLFIIF